METIKLDPNVKDEDLEVLQMSSESEKIVLAKNTLRGKMDTIKYDKEILEDDNLLEVSQLSEQEIIVLKRNTLRGKMDTI